MPYYDFIDEWIEPRNKMEEIFYNIRSNFDPSYNDKMVVNIGRDFFGSVVHDKEFTAQEVIDDFFKTSNEKNGPHEFMFLLQCTNQELLIAQFKVTSINETHIQIDFEFGLEPFKIFEIPREHFVDYRIYVRRSVMRKILGQSLF